MNPLIQGLFKKFCQDQELEGLRDSDAFEIFAATFLLPDDLLAQVPKTDLLLDANTIGVDVAVMEINGVVAWDADDVRQVCDQASKVDVALHFIQAKQSSTVSSAEILNFGDVVRSFLKNEIPRGYARLYSLADALHTVFDSYATKLKASPSVSLHFATTAPRSAVNESTVQERSTTVAEHVTDLGFVGKVAVSVLGADDLHDAWVRKNHENEVEIQLEKQVNLPKMPGIDQAILGVVSVSELLKLVESTEDQSLDERVFYDNVRGFNGVDNLVNRRIMETLDSSDRDLLPVLNNGVTVVASSYSPKPGDSVAISGFQVVNGCQTSHCLHLSRSSLGEAVKTVFVPLRLVVTKDEELAAKIIRATNSQTEVQENDLVALTKFQKRLEDFYGLDTADVKLTYERRLGQFYNVDVTKTRVVGINDQIKAISAVCLDRPHISGRYATRLYGEVGESIFREDHRLLPYVASAFAAYRLENAFRTGLDSKYKAARYQILMAYKYLTLGGKFAPLDKPGSEEQSLRLIQSLKQPDVVATFKVAAEKIVEVGGGQLPSSDRLKRQQFTQDLISLLMREREQVADS